MAYNSIEEIDSMAEGCTASSQDSGRGDARFELVLNL